MKPQIVNIINFIRGVEPRYPVDLLLPVKEQLALLEQYELAGTFLMQYDSLIDDKFVELLSKHDEDIEIGGWLEIAQPMCEAAGIPWRGRPGYSWDWHAHVGLTVGYSKEERLALIDVYMQKFKEVWGYYPRSIGSWIIDANTLAYLYDRYGIVASCNCKDQWGTDGYTLWGGYYNQAYYPSKNNVLCPAQTVEQQIPVPVFRMLGSDPIYQYDAGLDIDKGSSEWQYVVTLEPVYSGATGGGGVPAWVDWFFRENFNGICLSFGYTQVGQENSFGWEAMKDGLIYQMKKLAQLSAEGKISVQTLGQTGEWFKNIYDLTPASAVAALSDWKGEGRRSIWYNCRNYRVNFMCENNNFWIRDIYRFDERYSERYIKEICTEPLVVYDNLPVMDGNRWSGHGIRAGIYPMGPDGSKVAFEDIQVCEEGENLKIIWKLECGDKITCVCTPDMLEWEFPSDGYGLCAAADPASVTVEIKQDREYLSFSYRGFDYSIWLTGADTNILPVSDKAGIYIKSLDKVMQIRFVY